MPALSSILIGAGVATVGGGVMNYLGQQEVAEAQQGMSMAQLAAALENRNLAMNAARPGANELALQEAQFNQLADYYDQSQANLDKSFALADAMDPTITEAARQSYSLIRGQDSESLNPLKRDIAYQRRTLENSLRDSMGGGFSGTSAGQNALSRFDIRSNDQMTLARNQELGRLLGVAGFGQDLYGSIGSQMNSSASTFGALSSNALSSIGNTQNRMINAINSTNIAPYAGAQFVGDAARGSALAGLGGSLGNLGSGILGGALTGMMGGGSQRVPSGGRFQTGFTPFG